MGKGKKIGFFFIIGRARSGTTLLRSMFDAHPNVILPDEVDALKYLAAGFNRRQLCHLLLMRSQKQAKQSRRKDSIHGKKLHSYWVPGQWQGRFKKLQVICDSKAGVSRRILSQSPLLLHPLRDTIKANVKLIHVVRNPYDNITTIRVAQEFNRDFNLVNKSAG